MTEFPRLYLVAPAHLAAGSLAALVPHLVAAGVDLIQLREKDMEAAELIAHARPVVDACRAAGVPLLINDRPDVALAVGADGVHLGQGDLPVDVARRILGERPMVGRSTHAEREIENELRNGRSIDYLAVGPVSPTPTKPGRPGTGLDLVRYAAEVVTIPWFVTGGMSRATLDDVMAAGGRRIVVVRAIVDAPDPVAAAGELRRLLDRVPV